MGKIRRILFFIDIFLAFTVAVWFNMVSVLKKYQKAVM